MAALPRIETQAGGARVMRRNTEFESQGRFELRLRLSRCGELRDDSVYGPQSLSIVWPTARNPSQSDLEKR
jgi:hypothetical protein